MIRQAVPSGEPEVRTCAEQAYPRYVPAMGRTPVPMVADFPAQIAGGHVYVATDDKGVLEGFIVFYAEEGHVMLENVAVLPSVAGRGVGKRLIAFCEDTARPRLFGAVHLSNEKMIENLSIHTRLGHVEVGQRSEAGFNRVYFEKSPA